MNMKSIGLFVALIVSAELSTAENAYHWLSAPVERTVYQDIDPPEGFYRKPVGNQSFAHWLRNLPLKSKGSPVRLHSGARKWNQLFHAAIIDIDTGKKDLQQCADAAMRLWAEYLYAAGRHDDIRFNFTSGDNAAFNYWARGFRPKIDGNKVSWKKHSDEDSSYRSFRKYLDTIFTYAGSYSLNKELKKRAIKKIAPGDVFIQGGFPGHAVIVIDVVENDRGEKRFLLAQSYMPAQDIHILKNLLNPKDSPWYKIPNGKKLVTPEWIFNTTDLRRFPQNEAGAQQ